jgi:hypothetical protein|tara:strand:- start:325 stop:690 length:366 start_codon:yes stop_codon:yes gene_type:complete
MSTRAQIRFATRQAGQSFNEQPDVWHAQFYKHHDGYPEGLGVDIAESLVNSHSKYGVHGWEIEPLTYKHGDLQYIYYIWQAQDKETYISIFEGYGDGQDFKCVFVGLPLELTSKYIKYDRK